MKKSTGTVSVALALITLLSSCGGGGGDGASADATIYGTCGNTPNYLSELGDYSRWRKFPIKVGLDLTNAPGFSDPNVAAIYLRALQSGANAWSTAGNGIGAFTFVTGREADIIIEFDLALGTSGQLGLTFARWDSSLYLTGPTRVYLSAAYFSSVLANAPRANFESRLKEIVQHEMGHALFTSGPNGGRTQGNPPKLRCLC